MALGFEPYLGTLDGSSSSLAKCFIQLFEHALHGFADLRISRVSWIKTIFIILAEKYFLNLAIHI